MARHLCRLLELLKARGYAFVTSTPASHARVVARPERQEARSVEDVLGWSLPFAAGVLPADIETCLVDANMVSAGARGRRSRVRVSSLDGNLYLHSAYPTTDEDAVFFGPDSYRFAALVARELGRAPPRHGARIVDIGTGAGVGAVAAALLCPSARVVMTDVNGAALRLARVNARVASVDVEAVKTSGLDGIDGAFDVAIINPPYIIDEGSRAYRHGGAMHGAELSVELTRVALDRLAPGGRVVLYTGSAIIGGRDALRACLSDIAEKSGSAIDYGELDPDVFGEELGKPQYREVERIALVSVIIRRDP